MWTVLVVDDDDAWRLTLKQSLERGEVQIIGCSRGDWAMTAVQTHNPDVVLLDVQLPGRNGLDVLRSIRRRSPALPVIVTTAFGGDDMEQAALHAGASVYLRKPFRMERLLGVLQRIVGIREERKATEAP